jgi:hypothetical protein
VVVRRAAKQAKQAVTIPQFMNSPWRAAHLGGPAAFLGLMAALLAPRPALGGASAPTKFQVEAVFLFNFAKYVEWPPVAFPNAASPMTIGVLGADPFGSDLQHKIEGKTINGRSFIIKHLASDSDLSGCQMLFICESEASHMADILGKATALPILTVSENEPSAPNDGIINFVLKNGNVRLQIDLTMARQAGLTISSRLLAVADVVKGKSD